MSSLITTAPLHAHSLSLGILIYAYIKQTIIKETDQTNAAKNEQQQPNSSFAAGVAVLQTPSRPAVTTVFQSPTAQTPAQTSASPNIDDSISSFFDSPASSSVAATPQPKTFNLGLAHSATPATPSAITTAQPQTFHLGLGLKPASAQQTKSTPPSFSSASYQKLGLLLTKCIRKGGVHQEGTTNPHSTAASSSIPLTPPRYPTLNELRSLLLSSLPSADRFNLACESYLVQEISRIQHVDDVYRMVMSLSTLLINYTPSLPINSLTHHISSSSPLGLFLRQLRLQVDSGMFDTLSEAVRSVKEYRKEGGVKGEWSDEDEDVLDAISKTEEGEWIARHGFKITLPTRSNEMHDNDENAGVADDDEWYEVERPASHSTQPPSALPSPPSSTLAPFLHHVTHALTVHSASLSNEKLDQLITQLDRQYASSSSRHNHTPAYYYLCYLKHLLHHEYFEALAQCYRYWDYCTTGISGSSSKNNHQQQSYASLTLAQLHYTFGHYSSSVVSLQETIKLAQQNRDGVCLAYAMELLYKIVGTKGTKVRDGAGSEESNLMQRGMITQWNAQGMRRKSGTTNNNSNNQLTSSSSHIHLPELDARASLQHAKYLLTHLVNSGIASGSLIGSEEQKYQPREILRLIERAQILSSTSSTLSSLHASSLLLRSTAWMFYGSPQLSWLIMACQIQSQQSSTSTANQPTDSDFILTLLSFLSNSLICPTTSSQCSLLQYIKSRYPHPSPYLSSAGGGGVKEAVALAEWQVDYEEARAHGYDSLKVLSRLHSSFNTLSNLLTIDPSLNYKQSLLSLTIQLRLSFLQQIQPLTTIFLRLLALIQQAGREYQERMEVVKLMTVVMEMMNDTREKEVENENLSSSSSSSLLPLPILLASYSLTTSLHLHGPLRVEIAYYLASLFFYHFGDINQTEVWLAKMRDEVDRTNGNGSDDDRISFTLTPNVCKSHYRYLMLRVECEIARQSDVNLNTSSEKSHMMSDEGAAAHTTTSIPITRQAQYQWKAVIGLLKKARRCQ